MGTGWKEEYKKGREGRERGGEKRVVGSWRVGRGERRVKVK